ncbi:MAG: cytochrome P450 [Alphaproteobacteria bacterium]|nr:cytochrome P450 [Alphaproteobacteria bacterium]
MADATTEAALPPLDSINAFGPEVLSDPYPYYARLRAEAPVYRDPHTGIVYVSTYDHIIEVNSQPKVFSNKFGAQLRSGSVHDIDPEEAQIMAQGVQIVDTMLTADPPEQTRYRKLAMKAFTMKRVEGMEPYIRQVCNDLIDGFARRGECEFKSAFAAHVPMIVIADALGVPRADMDTFRTWSDAFIDQLGGVATKERRRECARLIVDFQRYMIDKIEEKRARPTDDVISALVHADLAEEGDHRKMEYNELLSILQQLLVAGNETTAHTITAGLLYLIANPDEMAKLRADPTLTPNLVEESLRMLTPTNNMWRVVKHDHHIGDFPVKQNELVLLRYGSANRDAAKFADADAFDVARPNAKDHLAFGAGVHHCLGAYLARKEMQIAFPIVLERLKNLRFARGAQSYSFQPNILMRGLKELHIAFDPA